MNFSHFCISDDPMKEVDPATQQEFLSRLNNEVDWDNEDKGFPTLIEILKEMSSFDINMVSDCGTIRITEYIINELEEEYGSDNR